MKFIDLIYPLLKREGGFVSHPNDRGGSTNYGITQTTYAKSLEKAGKPWADVRGLTEDTAIQIYHEMYWKPAKCDVLPAGIKEIHFDSAVNSGIARANKFLQESVGAEQDGILGPKTLAAANEIEGQLLKARYMNVRYRFYTAIVNRDRSQMAFLLGWLNRMTEFS